MPQRREAAIVGIHEYPLRVVGTRHERTADQSCLGNQGTWRMQGCPAGTSTPSTTRARTRDIGGLGISEYLGLKPRVIDNTAVGGTSYEFQANHAAKMIAAG